MNALEASLIFAAFALIGAGVVASIAARHPVALGFLVTAFVCSLVAGFVGLVLRR